MYAIRFAGLVTRVKMHLQTSRDEFYFTSGGRRRVRAYLARGLSQIAAMRIGRVFNYCTFCVVSLCIAILAHRRRNFDGNSLIVVFI